MFSNFLKAKNTSVDNAANQLYHVVFSLDVSGSMFRDDAHSRNTPGLISRLDAARNDICMWYESLANSDLIVRCDVMVFGSGLKALTDIKSAADLRNRLNAIHPGGSTATHLALAEANRLFSEHMAKYPVEPRPSFVNVICTDGSPDNKDACAEELIRGTVEMKTDSDRTTLFVQYGTTEYHEGSGASQFLAFLDDNLQDAAVEWFKKNYPQKTPDEYANLFDACDTGKQGVSWKEKDPEGKMMNVDRNAPWDLDLGRMVQIALCD